MLISSSDLHRARDRGRAAVQAVEVARFTLGNCDVCRRGIAVWQDGRAYGRSDGQSVFVFAVTLLIGK